MKKKQFKKKVNDLTNMFLFQKFLFVKRKNILETKNSNV
jgi:hypothetical protein